MTGEAFAAGKPAQEAIETLPASPKPANAGMSAKSEMPADSDDTPGSVVELEARRSNRPETDEAAADGRVTVRAKPEKRKNYKERAKEKYAKKDSAEDGTTPMTAKAKSEVERKAKAKALSKAASKAAKAERKAKRTAARAA